MIAAFARIGVAAALAAQAQAPAPPQAEVDRAIERGAWFLERFYGRALEDRSVARLERPGQSALSLYTLVQSGVAADGAVARALLFAISREKVEHTYDAGCLALALAACDPIERFTWLEDVAQRLLAWQTADGDWAYPEGTADLSNTQFAALGLWAAARAGVGIPPAVWQRLARGTLRYRCEDGGFGYAVARSGSTGSMTAAGVGTLAICEARLRLAGALSQDLADEIASARAGGMRWLTHDFSVETNPRSGAWHYYYLYGLERLGAFNGAARIGAHDWYGLGAAHLLAAQGEDGAWMRGADRADTCFALLFLRRATATDARHRGPLTGERPERDDDGAVLVTVEGAGPTRVRVDGWQKRAVRELEWPGERGLGPRVARVDWLVDGELASVVLGDPAQPARSERFADTLVDRSPGKRRFQARATLVAPSGAERTLVSRAVELDVTRALPAWTAEPRVRETENLASGLKVKVAASSYAKGKAAPFGVDHAPEHAVDLNPRTAWIADVKDAKRKLSISFPRSRECGAIEITPALLPGLDAGALARPVEVEIEVNGGDARRLAFDPDPRRPMRIALDPPVALRKIEIAITAVAPGVLGDWAGIGEVELAPPER